LPVVLYGCETWSLTLKEEHRLRVFENRVLRRIFGPKRDEVIGNWRKLNNEELHNLYYQVKEDAMGGACSMHAWERRGMHMGFWWEGRKERDHYSGKRIIVRWYGLD
jgi:hypothetical protein